MSAICMTASIRAGCDNRSVVSTCTVVICSSVNVTRYAPGGNAGNRYAPASPVTVLRVPCNAGEAIVTVTPGSA